MSPTVACGLLLLTAGLVEPERLSLAEAITTALRGNLGLRAVHDALTATEAQEFATRSAFLPQVTPRYARGESGRDLGLDIAQRIPWTGGSLQASANQSTRRDQGLGAALGPDVSSLTLTVTQPLLRGAGPTAGRFELVNAERARVAQQRSLALARQALVVEVTSAYYAVVKQRLTELVAQQSLKRSQDLARASTARMEVGLSSRLDVLRALLQAAQAESAVVAAETARAAALERFRVVIGQDPGAAVEPAAVELPAEETTPADGLEALLEAAREQRLELREARDQVHDAERGLWVARLALLPQVDLSLRATRLGAGDGFRDSFRRGDTRAEVLVGASYPLERGAASASRELALLGVEARRRAVVEVQRRVEADVRERVRALDALARNIALQRRSVEMAEQQQRLASLRYERGLASNFDVVDAESNLVAARTALVSLRSDFQVALVDLRRATGQLDPDAPGAP